MVDHRGARTRAYSLPGAFILLTLGLSVLGMAGVGWVVYDHLNPRKTVTLPSPTLDEPDPTGSIPTATTPVPTPTETAEPKRDGIDVVVLNATRTAGLAKQGSAKAQAAGWKVVRVGNWTTGADGNAVFYPPEHEDEAKLLAKDLGLDRTFPAKPGMSTDALTLLLISAP